MDRTRAAPSEFPYDVAFGGAARVYAEHFQALLTIVQPVEARPFPDGIWQHFPNRRKWYPTTDEFYVLQGDPEVVIRAIRSATVGPHHLIDLIGTDPASDDPVYKAAGYRLDSVEILMERQTTAEDLDRADDPRVVQTLTEAQIERLADVWNAGRTANGYQPITAAHNDYPGLVQRFVEIDGAPAAYGRAIVIGDDALLTDVNTFPAFRRQGLGRAIMDALHAGIAREGGRRVVLTSTEMGLPLYRQLGYRTLAEDWIYVSTP